MGRDGGTIDAGNGIGTVLLGCIDSMSKECVVSRL